MGRPKGSKNKPKTPSPDTPQPPPNVTVETTKPEKVKPTIEPKADVQHPLSAFVEYAVRVLQPKDFTYYTKHAKKDGVSLRHFLAQTIVGVLGIRDDTINYSEYEL